MKKQLLAIFILTLLLTACFAVKTQTQTIPTGIQKWLDHYDNRVALFEKENIELADDTRLIVLLGDSITERFDVKTYFPNRNVVNRGIASDHTLWHEKYGVLHRLAPEKLAEKPSYIFIMIGVNDIGDSTEKLDEYIQNYQQILDKLKINYPKAKVFIQNCLPAGGRFTRLNPAIEKYNDLLKTLAEKNKLNLVDIYSLYADEKGELKSECTRDGLHINKDAYTPWAELIKKEARGKWQRYFDDRVELFIKENQEYQLSSKPHKKRQIVMLGDSITNGFKLKKAFPDRDIYNRGIGCDQPEWFDLERGALHRLNPEKFHSDPTDIFIMLGANGLGNTDASIQKYLNQYQRILHVLKENYPAAKIYIQSGLPTRERYLRINEPMKKYNVKLRELALKNQAQYIDLHPLFLNEDGEMKAEYTRDGIHLTLEGYQPWIKVLKKIFKETDGK